MPALSFRSRRVWRTIFALSFIIRVYLAFQLSYLHPDEHLQGPQVMANGYFGWAAQLPWEFTCENPIRSMVPLWIVYGLPMSFFTAESPPLTVLYTLRAILALLTWILSDMAVDRLSKSHQGKLRSLLFVSTSYVTLTYQAHTLSNVLETILLLWCLVIIQEFIDIPTSPFDRHTDSILLGGIVTLGVFNRPTFLGFLALPALYLLKFFRKHPGALVTTIISGVAFSALFVYIDTLLYSRADWVITPLNYIRYNTVTKNLSIHGLHPRYFHLLVNVPILLGPGILLIVPNLSLSMQAVISGVVSLSLFPHQEPRFLLPILPLLCMNMDIQHFNKHLRWMLVTIWLSYNTVMGLLMGMYHQGGVIPAQAEVGKFDTPCTVLWWKTYTPPLWILGLSQEDVTHTQLEDYNINHVVNTVGKAGSKMTVVDLMGAPRSSYDKISAAVNGPTYVVAPLNENISGELIWQTNRHISFDHISSDFDLNSILGLGIWRLA